MKKYEYLIIKTATKQWSLIMITKANKKVQVIKNYKTKGEAVKAKSIKLKKDKVL